MKNLIKSIFVLLLLVFANSIHAQNACEFDSSYEETAQGHRILETENGNCFLVTLSGFDGGTPYFAEKLFLELVLIDKCGNQIWSRNIDSLGRGSGKVVSFYKEINNVLLCVVSNTFEGNIIFYKIDINGNLLHKWKYYFPNFQINNTLKIRDNKYITMGYLIQSNGSTSHNNSQIVMTDTLGNILATKKIYVDSNSKGQIFNGYKLSNNNILLLGSEDSSLRLTYIDTSLVITNNLKVKSSSYIGRLNEYIILNKDSSQILYTAPVYTNDRNSLQGFYLAKFDLLGNVLQEKNFFDIDRYGTGGRLHVLETNKMLFLKNNLNTISLFYLDSSFNIIKIDSIGYPMLTSTQDKRTIRNYIFTNDSAVVFAGSIEFISLMNYRTTVNAFKQSLFPKIKVIAINGASFINQKAFSINLITTITPSYSANKNILWSISDTNLATITQTGLVTAKANGTVIVTATAADGGGATATKTITITNQTVGINEVNLNNQIAVYPNPASNVLTIKTTSNLVIQQLQLLEITGKVIAQYHNQTEIDVSAIANGIYLLQIQTTTGNAVKQVVINK